MRALLTGKNLNEPFWLLERQTGKNVTIAKRIGRPDRTNEGGTVPNLKVRSNKFQVWDVLEKGS